MFYIDKTDPCIVRARNEHYINVRYVIKKKLLGNRFAETHPKGLKTRISQVTGVTSTVQDFFNDEKNLENILIGPPDVLDKLKDIFKSKKEKEGVKKLIRYDAFIDKSKDSTFNFYHAYHLAQNLDIPTCIYCNRLYTHTIITDKKEMVARATFDHWFPKGKYPLLALSFYNLIPSCNICNTNIKGSNPNELEKIFHPYLKHDDKQSQLDFRFSYTMEDHTSAQSSVVSGNKFSTDSIGAMKLKEMYSFHREEIRELIYLKKAYSEGYLSSLNSILKSQLTIEEIYRLAFGVHLEDDQLHRRPLSKLKKDILIELGILK